VISLLTVQHKRPIHAIKTLYTVVEENQTDFKTVELRLLSYKTIRRKSQTIAKIS